MSRAHQGRLSLRAHPAEEAPGGRRAAGFADLGESLGLVHVPEGAEGPHLLVVLLHGAGGSARQAVGLLREDADRNGLLLVAPQSVGSTWDVILGRYGPDVRRIERLVDSVLAGRAVRGLAVGGFSDGASYALSLGVGNGDVFDAVLAFSPGFMAPLEAHGRPRIFVSHGVDDRVLPIDRCSRRIVPQLQRAGYDVVYEEFDGGHVVPGHVIDKAVHWLGAGWR